MGWSNGNWLVWCVCPAFRSVLPWRGAIDDVFWWNGLLESEAGLDGEGEIEGAERAKKDSQAEPESLLHLNNPAIPTFTLVCTIIGSESLTAVFGMGTGVAFPIWSPGRTRLAIKPNRVRVVLVDGSSYLRRRIPHLMGRLK